MKRHLFSFTALISLSLCAATLLLWHRSSTRADLIAHWTTRGAAFAHAGAPSTHHQLFSQAAGIVYLRSDQSDRFLRQPPTPVAPGLLGRLGFWSRLQQSSNLGEIVGETIMARTPQDLFAAPQPPFSSSVPNRRLVVTHWQFYGAPHWIFVFGFAIVPACWFWKRWRERRPARRGFAVETNA